MAKRFYVYILSNRSKRVLYVGVTNDLKRRLKEHSDKVIKGFSQRYNCTYLLHYEVFDTVMPAIKREKQIKKFSRIKKEQLINRFNPHWIFLNNSIWLDPDN